MCYQTHWEECSSNSLIILYNNSSNSSSTITNITIYSSLMVIKTLFTLTPFTVFFFLYNHTKLSPPLYTQWNYEPERWNNLFNLLSYWVLEWGLLQLQKAVIVKVGCSLTMKDTCILYTILLKILGWESTLIYLITEQLLLSTSCVPGLKVQIQKRQI